MEPRQQLAVDGEEVALEDLNAGWKVGSLQDDRVLAELYRLAPFASSAAKVVAPYGVNGGAYDGKCSVVPTASANGSVQVMPFRAIVGSRSTIASFISAGETASQAASDNWRDIRSGVFAQSSDGTTLPFVQALAANSSGNPRWDLIYATLSVEANGSTDTRYVRPAGGGAPNPTTQVLTLSCPVTIGVQAGTPGASPAFPSAPADAGGNYYFPLAYVRVPNGFSATSTVSSKDIYDVEAAAVMGRTSGVANCAPANNANKQGGSLLAANQPWTTTAGSRPGCYLPPAMVGMESIFVSHEMVGATVYSNGAVIDDSRDWRYRAFLIFTFAIGSSGVYAFGDPAATGTPGNGQPVAPGIGYSGKSWGTFVSMGSSTFQDTLGLSGGSEYAIASYGQAAGIVGTTISFQAASSLWGYWVDPTTGALKFYTNGTNPQIAAFSWIFATASFPNF